MKINWRIIVGVAMVVLGGLALLQAFGILPTQGSLMLLLLAGIFIAGGLAFLYVLIANRENWWAAIPGFTLLGLGGLILTGEFLPVFAERFGAALFLGSISLAFWIVFAMRPSYWWAIIPAGALISIAIVTFIPESAAFETGGLILLGLAATFGVVGLVKVGEKRQTWPWIPAGILFLVGVLTIFSNTRFMVYTWPAVLIALGLYFLLRAVIRRQ